MPLGVPGKSLPKINSPFRAAIDFLHDARGTVNECRNEPALTIFLTQRSLTSNGIEQFPQYSILTGYLTPGTGSSIVESSADMMERTHELARK